MRGARARTRWCFPTRSPRRTHGRPRCWSRRMRSRSTAAPSAAPRGSTPESGTSERRARAGCARRSRCSRWRTRKRPRGATLAFVVTLAPAASGEVTVEWATADGTARGGQRLHRGERDAHLRGGRDADVGRGGGGGRRCGGGTGDADAHALQPLGGEARGRRGDGHGERPRPGAAHRVVLLGAARA